MLRGEPGAGAAEAGLHLVGDEDDALLLGPFGQARQEAVGRDDEAALALDRLDDDGGDLVAADLLLHGQDGALGGFLAGDVRVFLAERVAHRHAVDFRCQRAEAALVRCGLGGQAHGQVGAAVVRVVEGNDRVCGRWPRGQP